ncbi:MAG: RagB/SusD family nutrient uptake outer membrane protein [Paludibacter sp.]|nr:RagB/SusD family nutrient uptake outer membrane protein [Paludibacter sp.]
MKKNIYYSIFTALIILTNGCDLLDKNPLDSPNQATFWNNATEIDGGVVACYRFLIEYPNVQYTFPVVPDLMTDIGFPRQESDSKKIAQGQHDSNLSYIYQVWSFAYQGIGRCNLMLQTIEDKSSVLTKDQYNQYKGECHFLRAFYYSRLISYFGDVPLVLEPIETVGDAAKFERESKEVVLETILSDFTIAAALLKDKYTVATSMGRATKGAANAYKARIALYNKKWDVAIEAAQAVISSGVYDLYPQYGNLFLASGLTDATNKEIILKTEYSSLVPIYHQLPLYMQSRNMNAYSAMCPTQNLIDSYDCIDGKNISQSTLFNRNKPFENRDPRLRLGFVVPGDRYGDFQFESHVDSSTCWNYALKKRVTNMDCYTYSPYTSYTGYLSRKYSDPAYSGSLNQKADYPLILCRYAEVLLTYAEAKIEANEIDESVVNALNKIRNGRDDVKMPVFTLADLIDQAKARVIVRHERKVELAFEGFRYFDLRRWDGFWKYANQPVMGRPFKGSFATWPTVTFDENDEPVYDYNNYAPHPSTDYRVVENRVFIQNKHELWPIPQRERNVSPQLSQNPNF